MIETQQRLPSLNALRAFEAAARHLNFRVAADELGVTQGAVAQHVRGLESDLGLKLFERQPRLLALTSAGRSYATHVAHAFALLAEATDNLRPQPLRLTISATPSIAAKWLVPRLPDFTAAHPQLELNILASDALANFQSDGVDIAIRQGRPPFGPGLTADLLFEHEIVAACHPSLRPAEEELARLPLLRDGHDLWPEFFERALGRPMPLTIRSTRFNQTALAIDAAIAGQGIALASRFLIEPDLAAGRLALATPANMRGGLDFYVVCARRPRHPEQATLVKAWLLAQRS
ncbi:LysR family transcriptional regulator [Bosea sp. Tri-44]|uniref:LysR substrate-binding domain-containing protein n=1 Tax=Bosea sp. Tri-44 TaxID=1972137 RepID=UPI00100F5EE3|nr:LysR substrate-binding domain-containing protein [Bosea sp. Tri-44]RXT55542.1 LysR family transcriptional regulator [Bosea sp. Tri-44]